MSDFAIMEKRAYVYIHRRKTDGLIFYVGKGSDPYRFRQKTGRNSFWQNTAKKHGWTAEKIMDNLTDDQAFALEIQTIAELRSNGAPLTNISAGGEGVTGYRQTPEHIEKRTAPRRGRKMTAEAKAGMYGRTMSAATREKLSIACRGFKHTAEAKAKITAAQIGAKHHAYDARLICFEHPDHGRVTLTQHEMAKSFNLRKPLLCAIIKGRRKSTQGWKFMGFKE